MAEQNTNPFPADSLITDTPAEGRALAVKIARHTVKTIQPNAGAMKEERDKYASNADSLTMATHVVAVEFQTIAMASNYWRDE